MPPKVVVAQPQPAHQCCSCDSHCLCCNTFAVAPLCVLLRRYMKVPGVSARFGTDPFIWNWAMWLVARLCPRQFLQDRSQVSCTALYHSLPSLHCHACMYCRCLFGTLLRFMHCLYVMTCALGLFRELLHAKVRFACCACQVHFLLCKQRIDSHTQAADPPCCVAACWLCPCRCGGWHA